MRDFEWPNGVHVRVVEPLTTYAVRYSDPGALEVDLVFEAIMEPNPHPNGVVPFLKGAHFDQAGHVTGTMILHGEEIPVDCYSVRDRSWGPRPLGRPKPRPTRGRRRDRAGRQASGAGSFGGVGYSFCAAGPGEAWLTYAIPGPEVEPVACGFLLRDGEYGHILAGERRVTFDAQTGWPLSITLEAVDEFDRRLSVRGDAVSRHWRGHGGDSFVHWTWDDGSRRLGRGPELLQPRPVGGQPPEVASPSCIPSRRRHPPHAGSSWPAPSCGFWWSCGSRRTDDRKPPCPTEAAACTSASPPSSGIVGAVVLTRNVSSGRISPDVAWAGLVVFWCGIALRFWSFRSLGRYFTFTVQTSVDQPVITSGPYRFVRHPSYAAVLLMVMGVGLFLGSWWSFAWLTASVFCGFLFRIRVEERALLLQLGERYVAYAADHKRLVPFIW